MAKPSLTARILRRILPARLRDQLTDRRRSYDAASVGRRVSTWNPGGTDADAEVLAGGARLRNRSRELARNNPTAKRALSILTLYVAGTGIRPRPATGNPALDRLLLGRWNEWGRDCRAESRMGIYGLQSLAIRSWFESGEVLLRRRWRPTAWKLPVPLQLQAIEPDYLDDTLDQALSDGARIIGGIESDITGRRRAYHLWREHPGASIIGLTNTFQSVVVPSSEIIHLYQETRPGQMRGVPWLHAVMTALYDIGGYQDGERIRKKTESMLTAIVTGSNPDEIPSGEEADGIAPATAVDSSGLPIEMLEPGLIAYLPPGKEIKFSTPSATMGYREFIRVSLHEIAAGLDIPYEALTTDLTEVNFSSIKVGRIELRLLAQVLRQQVVIPLLCDPIWDWFCEAAALVDPTIPPGRIPVEWTEPQVIEIDRFQDAQSDELEMRIGTRSRIEIVTSKGRDPAAVDKEIADDHAAREKAGIILDSDPAQTGKAGTAQPYGDTAEGDKIVAKAKSSTIADEEGENA